MELESLSRSLSVHPVVRAAARIGLVVKGFVYVSIGVVALGIAGGLGGTANQAGALAALATTRTGLLLLWVATAGLWGMVLWQSTQAVWVRETRPLPRLFRRLVPLGKSLGYAATSLVTLAFALGYQIGPDNAVTELATLLVATAIGIAILLLAGGITIAVGCAALFRGASRRFVEEVDPPTHPAALEVVVRVIGILGYLAKGVAFAVAGGLVVAAAVYTDPSEAAGLDGALKYLTTLPLGPVLLAVVASGLFANGLYLFARAVFLPPPESSRALA